jgi:hypothetical protein
MASPQSRLGAAWSQTPAALLLFGTEPSSEERNLANILNFFGIRPIKVTDPDLGLPPSDFCLLSPAPCIAKAMQMTGDSHSALPRWMSGARSIYIFAFQDSESCRELLRLLTGDKQASIRSVTNPKAWMSIAGDYGEMCGPMSGMRIPVGLTDGLVCDFAPQGEGFQSIIKLDHGHVFFRVIYQGVQFYINVSRRIVDIDAPSEQYFDVRKLFCEAVPTAMFVKWAFRDVCWASSEINACLIVDDPLLRPRYGFLHFKETLELMDRCNFTTTIAFIPHNWRRTDVRTVNIFQQRPDRLSICVHGCDHTALEFAARSTALLNQRLKTASKRTELLQRRSRLLCQRVMVFPQGAFSPETGYALKLNNYVAAVNTEVAPWGGANNKTTIRDLWNVAIMKYGSFPIFTRRYPAHGIENFAFDGLLGKPCLIVTHHDAFKGHGRDLTDFITKLNSLNWQLRWRTLGDAMSRSYKACTQADGSRAIQMFAGNVVVENTSWEPLEVVLMKEESDPECVEAVTINQTAVDLGFESGCLQFKARLEPRTVADIRVIYFDKLGDASIRNGLGYKIEARARRYLSEFRDNYVSQNEFLYQMATNIRRLLKLK